MTNLESLRRAYGEALHLCEFFGWDADELLSGIPPLESEFNFENNSERGRMERLAVDLANSLRKKLHQAEENAFWQRRGE